MARAYSYIITQGLNIKLNKLINRCELEAAIRNLNSIYLLLQRITTFMERVLVESSSHDHVFVSSVSVRLPLGGVVWQQDIQDSDFIHHDLFYGQ